jgi:branched-chain amino acid transport system substrate-binding protein
MSFSNDETAAAPGVYLMSFFARDEIQRVVSFAIGSGRRRFTALIPRNAYGAAIEPMFRNAVEGNGGEIVALGYLDDNPIARIAAAKSVFKAITNAAAHGAPVDALFAPVAQSTIAEFGPLIAYAGIDTTKVKLIGLSAWDQAAVSSFAPRARDPRLIGAWYAAPEPSGFAAFSARFKTNFGNPPPRLASLAYDAMTIAIALSATPPPGRFASESIERPEGFNGVDGALTFSALGLAQRRLAILEIGTERATVIDPAARQHVVSQG